MGSQLSIGEVKDRLQSLASPENLLDTYERFTQHLADNKLDSATTKLGFGVKLAVAPE